MHRRKLTNSSVEAFTCRVTRSGKQKTQDFLWCGETRGFGVLLSAKTGTRTYVLRYRVKGTAKERVLVIGRHNDPWRVDQARAKALELKAQMLGGLDPVEEERKRVRAKRERAALEAALTTTLREVMEHYLEHKRTKHGPLRPETQRDLRRHVEVNLADWIDHPVARVTRDKALAKFVEITERGAPIQANACMRYLRALCNHAREMHATPDGTYPVLTVNPVTQMFRLRKPNRQKARTERIPLSKVGAVWAMLRTRATSARLDHGRTACDWLCMVMLTGLRRTESGAIRKVDVDLEEKTIRLRGDVDEPDDGFAGVKNHNDMILPISTLLHDILAARITAPLDESKAARRRRRERSGEYVFPGFGRKKPYIASAPAELRAISKIAGCNISLHSLRRTAEDIAKAVKVDSDERRQLLNHLASDVHGQSYANNPDPEVLRPAVEAIAQYVENAAKVARAQANGTNVVSFPVKSG